MAAGFPDLAQSDVHARQIGDTLEEFLTEATEDSKLRQVIMSLSEAVRTIAFKVRPLRIPAIHFKTEQHVM